MTLSTAVMKLKRRMFWKVRAIPSLVIRCGGSPDIDSPSRVIDPLVIGKSPVTQLNAVVFPAPFGPIIDRISPRSSAKLTLDTARRPPNRLVTLLSSSSATSGDSLHRRKRLGFAAALELDCASAAG